MKFRRISVTMLLLVASLVIAGLAVVACGNGDDDAAPASGEVREVEVTRIVEVEVEVPGEGCGQGPERIHLLLSLPYLPASILAHDAESRKPGW